MLGACANNPYQPAPIQPEVETVTVYRDLPPNLLKPCWKPVWDDADILTDVDLLGLTNRFAAALDNCADQVGAIADVYKQAGPPAPRPPQ